jgi:hypothetical protein
VSRSCDLNATYLSSSYLQQFAMPPTTFQHSHATEIFNTRARQTLGPKYLSRLQKIDQCDRMPTPPSPDCELDPKNDADGVAQESDDNDKDKERIFRATKCEMSSTPFAVPH